VTVIERESGGGGTVNVKNELVRNWPCLTVKIDELVDENVEYFGSISYLIIIVKVLFFTFNPGYLLKKYKCSI